MRVCNLGSSLAVYWLAAQWLHGINKSNMKRLLVALVGFACVLSLVANAAEGDKHKATPEQKALKKELMDKYDTNKDGKLDKEERAKMSKEDKDKLEKAGLGHKKKKQSEDNQ